MLISERSCHFRMHSQFLTDDAVTHTARATPRPQTHAQRALDLWHACTFECSPIRVLTWRTARQHGFWAEYDPRLNPTSASVSVPYPAVRKQCLKVHPDKNPDAGATLSTQEVMAARGVFKKKLLPDYA